MKSVKEMSPAEYNAARAAALRPQKRGMTNEERADLAQRRGEPAAPDVRTMSSADYARAKAKAVRGT